MSTNDILMCDKCKTTTHEELVRSQEVEPEKGKLALDLWDFNVYWHRKGDCLRFPSKGQDNRWEYLKSSWKHEKKTLKIFIVGKAFIEIIKRLFNGKIKNDVKTKI